MNKAAAIGFGAGVIFLVGVIALFGADNAQKKLPGSGRPGGAAVEGRLPVNEESAESDTASKPAERKLAEFKPAGVEPLNKAVPTGGSLKVARSATPGGYRAGQALDVILSFDHDGQDKVTALALVERLPKGWTFQEISGGAKPVIAPAKGAVGELTFVWVQVPAFPCTVGYRIMPGPDVAGPQELEGQAVYRQSGPEQRTEMVKTVVTAAAQ